MKLLLFSDLHRDLEAARALVAQSEAADVVVGAGDFATKRRGLDEVIDVLSAINKPAVLVCGNGESPEELRDACDVWPSAHVLHGDAVSVSGVRFFGLGGAVPVTPLGDWSYDIDEADAAKALESCPKGAVLVCHSPPLGHADADRDGTARGSEAILAVVQRTAPVLMVCGHIHDSWTERSRVGRTEIVNAGPGGVMHELDTPTQG